MHAWIPTFTPAVVVVLVLGATGCGDNHAATLNARLNGPSPLQAQLASVEPAIVTPEFLPGPLCGGLRPFRTRFDLFLRADRDLFLRGLRFEFRDRNGGRALPLPVLVTLPTVPGPVPLPLTTSLPNPIPGSLPFHGVAIPPVASVLGILLNFDCGVRAEGTLSIGVEVTARDGGQEVSHVMVRVGG